MSQPIVVIDPGHGGTQVNQGSSPLGVRGPTGLLEKDVTLALAQRVSGRLGGHARTILTREGDTNPSLAHRSGTAHTHAADVFLSLHANAGDRSQRGTEVYVHEQSNGASQALADRVSRALSAVGLPQLGLQRAPMAVLQPPRLGGRAAACLVEIDYLSNPDVERRLGDPGELDAIADHLSQGIVDYLQELREQGYGGARPGRYGDGFNDAEQMRQYLRDERADDTQRVSTVADAQALVDAYLARGASTVWPNLDAQAVAQQVRDRCADYRLFQQGNLNLCGPAAFLFIWASRDPCGYANYALGLLENGSGRIGTHTVNATSTLEAIPYPRLGHPSAMTAPAADFLCMAPLRDNTNEILPYDPSSGTENLEGLTTPGQLAKWLGWTGAFSTVRNEGNWMRSAGIDHALGLMTGAGMDTAMLINVNALASAQRVEEISGARTTNPVTPDRSFILNMFPDHFVVLLSELTPDTNNNTVSLSAWTWAGSYVFSGIPVRTFSTNYYGAVKTFTRR